MLPDSDLHCLSCDLSATSRLNSNTRMAVTRVQSIGDGEVIRYLPRAWHVAGIARRTVRQEVVILPLRISSH